jgi:hypothetical protein
MAYSADGTTLAIAWSVPPLLGKESSPGIRETFPVKDAHRVRLFDPATGQPMADRHGQETSIGALQFSPDAALLVATGDGKMFTLIDAATTLHFGAGLASWPG